MLNPIFKENVQGRKHTGNCTFAESELPSYRKPNHVVQNEKDDHKNPNDSHNSLGFLDCDTPKKNSDICAISCAVLYVVGNTFL